MSKEKMDGDTKAAALIIVVLAVGLFLAVIVGIVADAVTSNGCG